MNDGVALPLRHWPAEGKTKAVVLALHGFNDYSKAFEEPAKDWAKAGIETYAYDQRGFGETPYHGLWPGNQRLIEDAKAAAKVLQARRPDRPFYVLGESMGGAVVMAAATDPDPIKANGLILVAPAIWGRDSIGWMGSDGLWFFAHTIPWYTVDGRGLRIEPSDNRDDAAQARPRSPGDQGDPGRCGLWPGRADGSRLGGRPPICRAIRSFSTAARSR